jgi:predicted nuclease of predicted toxin-antitoxin system
MKFLADESVDFPIILFLRQHGFDVRSVSEEFPSKDDEFVLETANVDDRLLITSDKDFGELVYRLKKVHKGVILLRIEELNSAEKADLFLTVIRERKEELLNSFVVVRREMVRIRKI